MLFCLARTPAAAMGSTIPFVQTPRRLLADIRMYTNIFLFLRPPIPSLSNMKRITLYLFALIISTITSFAQADCPTATDTDGNTYQTVRIGTQCWMAENMRATHNRSGQEILLTEQKSDSTPYRYCPNGRARNVKPYGYLYNWEAAKVVCPKGWHLPSDAEWTQLTDFVSSQSQYICNDNAENNAKALAATSGWKRCMKSCTAGYHPEENNATGFAVLPAGGFYDDGYGYFSKGTFFWTSTEYNNESAYKRYLDYDTTCLVRYTYLKIGGGAVRCVRSKK